MAKPNIIIVKNPILKADIGVIKNLFEGCLYLLFQSSQSHPNLNAEIRVNYGTEGPRVRYGGNSTKGYDIDLTAENDDWCKHLYQFGHEACHILAQFQQNGHSNQWFEESLCETASLYILKTIAHMGSKGIGPCINLFSGERPYHSCLKDYADQYIYAPARCYNYSTLRLWYQQVAPILRNDPYCRCLNGVVTNKLLPLFEERSSNWAAIEFLNTKPCSSEHDSLSDYLDNWKGATGRQYHELICKVRKLLIS